MPHIQHSRNQSILLWIFTSIVCHKSALELRWSHPLHGVSRKKEAPWNQRAMESTPRAKARLTPGSHICHMLSTYTCPGVFRDTHTHTRMRGSGITVLLSFISETAASNLDYLTFKGCYSHLVTNYFLKSLHLHLFWCKLPFLAHCPTELL